ncbi:hypothetical protein [Carboxylicivirga marina]|uniref:hypothetical protein n=1 Tax=Carboxylicivirga marina TaxID=2800988 RepID=UPI002595D963|nr:hypothetical protein [uncultured Carboxylicivirga sp.]
MIPFDNKHVWKFLLALPIGFVIMAGIGIYFQKQEWKQYPETLYQTELEGEVSKKKLDGGGIFLELNCGKKFNLPSSYNFSYSSDYIGNFIRRGDYIVKTSGSDSIFIYRDSIKYYFVLGERLEKKKLKE